MREIIIMDGAMGTYLKSKNIEYNKMLECNIKNKDLIENIHKQYIYAGSKIISLNTFMSLSLIENSNFEKFNIVIDEAINIGLSLKNFFKDSHIKTSLDFAPLSNMVDLNEIRLIYNKVSNNIGKKQFDYIFLETQYKLNETIIALNEFSKIDKPIMVSFTFNNENKLYSGESIKEISKILNKQNYKNIIAVGTNCCDPIKSVGIVKEFKRYSDFPIIAKPNLGVPKGNLIYDFTTNEFKNIMKILKEEGATFLGGCCGTTPEYIKAISYLKDSFYKF